MVLTRSLVDAKAAAYRREEPLYVVEAEQVETLPGALAAGEYGWRDVEWVVRWHYRRSLGGVPNAERRAAEARFGENEFDAVRDALVAARERDAVAEKLDALTALAGVDVPVASAFLFFLDPGRYLVVGDREWRALAEAGELDGPYPDPPDAGEYERYLAACRSAGARLDCDLWTLYRALWRLSKPA